MPFINAVYTNDSKELFDLFSGVAVVIDDQFKHHETNEDKLKPDADGIMSIVRQLEAKNIPILGYTNIPSPKTYKNFHNISFVLLDWKLNEELTTSAKIAGVDIPSDTQKDLARANIKFIENLRKICFAPIFIFTNEDCSTVEGILEEKGLYNSDSPNYIFIESKKNINDNKLSIEINKWIKENPPVYVLKQWEKHFRDAKNKTFFKLYDISPSWPKVLWKAFKSDSGNPDIELRETISQNINSVMDSLIFDQKYIINNAQNDPASIIDVLDGAKFIENKYLDQLSVRSGDLYFVQPDDGSEAHYLLNIRADCDLIDRKSKVNDSVTLYCIYGQAVDYDNIRDKDSSGYVIEKVNNAIVYALDENKIVEFCFKKLIDVQYNKVKDSRRGRLLHPYISRIQQRFAFYIHRHGTPRPPISFIKQ